MRRPTIPWKVIRTVAIVTAAITILPATQQALAYFTSNASAEGGFFLRLEPDTEIRETYGSRTKHVVVENKIESVPLYVRIKAFSSMSVSYDGTGWGEPADDGWVYYDGILDPGSETPSIDVTIEFPTGGTSTTTNPDGTVTTTEIPAPQSGDEHDVIVVYETTPVLYDESGDALGARECWAHIAGKER